MLFMTKSLFQTAIFQQSPKTLYETYMNAGKHKSAIGSVSKTTVEPRVGGRFRAYGELQGRFLKLIKNRLIVQTWRAKSWKKKDADSILVLHFKKHKRGTRLELHHINIPDHDYKGIQKGWPSFYWKKWKQYFRR